MASGTLPSVVNQIVAPAVALVMVRLNALEKKPRPGLNLVSPTNPRTPGPFNAPGVGVGRSPMLVLGFESADHDLHAWAEVYIPGGGWRGFDPSVGLAVADGHIALASAALPELAAPVSGTYRGSARVASFEAKVELRRLD